MDDEKKIYSFKNIIVGYNGNFHKIFLYSCMLYCMSLEINNLYVYHWSEH